MYAREQVAIVYIYSNRPDVRMQEYHVRNDRYHASSCIHLQTD